MTERRPLVLISGRQQELPSGDSLPGAGAAGPAFFSGGRATTESGVPVSSADRTNQSTIYWTPFGLHGNVLTVFDANDVATHLTFAELSLSISGKTAGKLYTVYGYNNNGVLALEESAAWTNDTTPSEAFSLVRGVYVKTSDHTRRCLFVYRATSATQTQDAGGGSTSQAGGQRFVANFFNQQPRTLSVFDSADNWTYGTASYRICNGATAPANCCEFVCAGPARVKASGRNAGNNNSYYQIGPGIGIDSAANAAQIFQGTNGPTTSGMSSEYSGVLATGYHYASWLECGSASGTTYFYGDQSVAHWRCGLTVEVWQ